MRRCRAVVVLAAVLVWGCSAGSPELDDGVLEIGRPASQGPSVPAGDRPVVGNGAGLTTVDEGALPPPTDEHGEWVDSDVASPDVLPPDAWDLAYDGEGVPDDARHVAVLFVLMLQSWSWEQPEADRIDGLAPYMSDEAHGQLRATEGRWDDLDATRTFAEEVAVASLVSVHAGEVADGQVRFDVWTSTVRTDRFGRSVQDAMVRVWVADGPQGGWQVVGFDREAGGTAVPTT